MIRVLLTRPCGDFRLQRGLQASRPLSTLRVFVPDHSPSPSVIESGQGPGPGGSEEKGARARNAEACLFCGEAFKR